MKALTALVNFPTSNNTWQHYSTFCWSAAGCLASSSCYWSLPPCPCAGAGVLHSRQLPQECPWAPVNAVGQVARMSHGHRARCHRRVNQYCPWGSGKENSQLCGLLCVLRRGNSGNPDLSPWRTQLHSKGKALGHDFFSWSWKWQDYQFYHSSVLSCSSGITLWAPKGLVFIPCGEET